LAFHSLKGKGKIHSDHQKKKKKKHNAVSASGKGKVSKDEKVPIPSLPPRRGGTLRTPEMNCRINKNYNR